MTVSLHQEFDGIRVENGRINALFNTRGDLLSLHNTTAPFAELVDTKPALSAASAQETALQLFARSEGLDANDASAPTLMIAQFREAGRRTARLAWQMRVLRREDGSQPIGSVYTIDATTGRMLRRDEAVHHFDVTGKISTLATPGTLPDTPTNPPQIFDASHIRVTAPGQVMVNADRFGNFTFPGVNTPLDITILYRGPFARAINADGDEYSVTFPNVQPNTPNTFVLNPNGIEEVTAQANAFQSINHVRDFVRDTIPTDSTADFAQEVNVNIDDFCNGNFDGTDINLYAADSIFCYNASFSTFIAHEQGHDLNIRYGTGNGPDGMGEGNADVFAMYAFDTPWFAEGFTFNGQGPRTGLNGRLYCGDSNPGCYGEVHEDGEVWMGAAWKVRAALKTSLGAVQGGATADTLFLSWMNAFNQQTIDSIIEIQWLTLDDDDGDIDNGTPNYAAIDGGFREQGFPGFELLVVDIDNVNQLPDVPADAGPYTVNAKISALYNPPIQAAELFWRIDGGAFNAVPMTALGGDDYTAEIPAQMGLGEINYYISAVDSTGEGNRFPRDGADDPLFFDIAAVTLEAWNFESGPEGWTVAAPNHASDGHWVSGDPVGSAAQPEDDHSPSGTNCWFTGQGVAGEGPNKDDVDNGTTTLYSPIFDAAGRNQPSVSYWRWYSNDEGNNPNLDYMPIDITNDGGLTWTLIELHGGSLKGSSGGWFQNRVTIADFVTPTSQMQIRFRARDLDTGAAVEAAVDDVVFYYYDDFLLGTRYCSPAAANSSGLPSRLNITGSEAAVDNSVALESSQLPANQFGIYLASMTQGFFPNPAGSQGNLCLGGDIGNYSAVGQILNSGPGGQYSLSIDLNQTPTATGFVAIQAGETWNFQSWHRDFLPGLGATSNFTDAISITFQ